MMVNNSGARLVLPGFYACTISCHGWPTVMVIEFLGFTFEGEDTTARVVLFLDLLETGQPHMCLTVPSFTRGRRRRSPVLPSVPYTILFHTPTLLRPLISVLHP